MNSITLDDQLQSKLQGMSETVEVRDAKGRIVGYFLPQSSYYRLVYDWAKSTVTDEELNRSRQQPGTKTLQEILRELPEQ